VETPVDEIAGAAQDQAAGLDQVSRAIAGMDKVTQQNAASAEESSSAAAELNGQAEELAAMVASFRMEAGGEGAGPQERARNRPLPGRARPGP
jgi:methyl-accepting chemotaxis protein